MCWPELLASKGPNVQVIDADIFVGANGPKGPLGARFMGLTAHKPC